MAKKTEPITKRVGNRIAELRQARKWSQAELANCLQVESKTISHLESGTSTPSLQMLESLAAALQVRISDLIVEPSVGPDHQAMQISAWLSELEPVDNALVTGVIQQLCERMRARGRTR